MKILGICLVKNEADIIAYSLTEASKWADKIFVYDNGSTDGTWETVQELSKANPSVVPFKSESKLFRDGLRAEVFNEYKYLAREGDWWCVRLDSDEFYIDNPKEFLPKISRLHHVVTSLHYEYHLTHEDLQYIDFSNSIKDIITQIRYYNPKVTSETRFIRHRNRLRWSNEYGFPFHKGVISPFKIRLRHFQYRSPDQIKMRINIRKKVRQEGFKFFKKDDKEHWEDVLLSRSELIRESDEMNYERIQDFNTLPWYHRSFQTMMHLFKIFP